MKKQTSYSQTIGPLEMALLLFLLLLFLIIKVFFLVYANPLPDEAYYWLWSKNIALSYFDHPPLAAWTQAFLLFFSDNKYFAIRALPILSLGLVIAIMIAWQRHMSERLYYSNGLKSIVLFLAFPIYAIFFSVSFPDHLLITLLFASSFCLFLYFETNNKLSQGIHYWYLAVLFFSLALLAKYNAVLFGIGVLAYILYFKKRIGGPSLGHILGAIVIICLIQMPVLLWNLGNDFASFSFHLGERMDKETSFLTVFRNVASFLLGVLIAFSPIFIFNLKNNYSFVYYRENRKSFITMSKFILFFSLIFCLFLSVFTNVLYYWLTPAIVLFIPFLINILKFKLWQYLHIFYGIVISLILVVNISIYPISAFFGNVDRETAISYGWKKIVEVVEKEKKLHGIERVIFSDYRLGSLYIFHSEDLEADVVMEERKTQFDVWRDEVNSLGINALLVTDNDFPLGHKLSSRFENIEFVRDIEIRIGSKTLRKYQVFLGTNG